MEVKSIEKREDGTLVVRLEKTPGYAVLTMEPGTLDEHMVAIKSPVIIYVPTVCNKVEFKETLD